MVNCRIKYLSAIILIFILGCATTTNIPPKPNIPGFYYYVHKGDTLYRISRTYVVDLDTLVIINKIPDASRIEIGQRIFIPKITTITEKKQPIPQESSFSDDNFIWPVKGKVISYFNQKVNNIFNKGIDIKANLGQDVLAAGGGSVSFCGELLKGYGKTIIIQHHNRISSIYSNVYEAYVDIDDKVNRGQVIAKVGMAGRAAIPYLHFEIREGAQAKNPLYFLP